MLRHVVLFTWTDDADDATRAATVAALRRLPAEVGGMTAFAVGPDADAFARYADHPVHLEVVAAHVRPWLAARSAVQFEV